MSSNDQRSSQPDAARPDAKGRGSLATARSLTDRGATWLRRVVRLAFGIAVAALITITVAGDATIAGHPLRFVLDLYLLIPSYWAAIGGSAWLNGRGASDRSWNLARATMAVITATAIVDVLETTRQLAEKDPGWTTPTKWILFAVAVVGAIVVWIMAPRTKSSRRNRNTLLDLAGAELAEGAPDKRNTDWRPVRLGDSVQAQIDEPHQDLFGLALSGGGIRSATFNLGILQALADLDMLDKFDYLSTVSGGGYIGAFWTAWRSRGALGRDEAPRFPGPSATSAEGQEIRHLREFSNFLSPRLGLLSYDFGRMVVAGLSAALPALVATFAFIALVLLVWGVAFWMIALSEDRRVAVLAVSLIAGIVLVTFELSWRRAQPPPPPDASTRRGDSLSSAEVDLVGYVVCAVVGLAAVGATTWWLARDDTSHPEVWWAIAVPALIWLTGAGTLIVLRFATSNFATPGGRLAAVRQAGDRVISRLLLCAVAWAVIAALWVIGERISVDYTQATADQTHRLAQLVGSGTVLGFAFRWVQKLISERPSKLLDGTLGSLLKRRLPQLLAYATIAVMVIVIAAVMSIAYGKRPDAFIYVVYATLGVTGATLFLFDPNEVGLHTFYRARLVRAYLGASNRERQQSTEPVRTDDIELHRLTKQRPVHLVCCTANDLAGDQLANLHRGAVSAVLSPAGYAVGNACATWDKDRSSPTLGSAITASGAAFNSHMGALSMQLGPAVTFLMTAFNLRLGLWLPHPDRYDQSVHRFLPGLPFYFELLGISKAKGSHVLLSDGGHFENMAIYELLRRHCRFIIASDCGADPDVAFDDLGNLVRRAREDFNIEIDIDLSPLHPDKKGVSRQPMVAGDVHYPNGDVGVLLVVKPSITGNEPVDVGQYRRRNPDFPHESTGDQFYDEAQWESYRRLGIHVARASLSEVIDAVKNDRQSMVASSDNDVSERRSLASHIFARARMRWQPMPANVGERLDRIANRIAVLDSALQQDSCKRILRQVYREIDALDAAVKQRNLAHLPQTPPPPTLPPHAAVADQVVAPSALPPREDLAPSLHVLREAILFMEEMFISEELERTYNHPLYLGLMNYFARWAFAPIFRMWWPLLKSLYCREFTSFMERRFGLQGINTRGDATECLITSIAPVGEGFAAHCWTLAGNDESRPRKDLGELLLSFNLQMRYRGEARPYNIEAALAFLFRDDNRVLFRGDDFYVPPGLWGIGIGESFLNALIDRQSPLFEGNAELAGVDTFVVAIEQKRGERGVIRKTGADMTAMYRTAGFTCTSPASLGERGWSPLLETVKVAGNDDVRLLIRQLPKVHP